MPRTNSVHQGDCLEVMEDIPDKSIDMILADLPYGTTACHWDRVIPLESLWKHYKRIIKPRGAIVLTASQPFTSMLVMSNLEWFKYEWIWGKTKGGNFFNIKLNPLKKHESIVIFSPANMSNGNLNNMIYNPQGIKKTDKKRSRPKHYSSEHGFVRPSHKLERTIEFSNYPNSIIDFPVVVNSSLHPTQKPVALFAYLIRTYTDPGMLVLDNAAGSCTTAIAAIETGRDWICIEKELEYVEIGRERIAERLRQPFLPGINEANKKEKSKQASFF